MPEETGPKRSNILIRLLYSVVYLIALELVTVIVQLTVLIQFVYLLITKEHIEPLRNFSNKLSLYGYKCLRYVTLNENGKPFPFSEFPKPPEAPESKVEF